MNNVIEPHYFRYTADPADFRAYAFALARDGADPLLGADETPLSFAINPTPAAVAAGVQISTASGKAPLLAGDAIHFWLGISPARQADPLFDAPAAHGTPPWGRRRPARGGWLRPVRD